MTEDADGCNDSFVSSLTFCTLFNLLHLLLKFIAGLVSSLALTFCNHVI